MRSGLIFFLISLLFVINSCDIFNSNSNRVDTEVLQLGSEITDNVRAKDVVQVEDRIFILGQAEKNKQNDFYLAEIDQTGQLLWEKMYGTDHDEIAKTVINTSDDHLLLVGGTQPDRQMYVAKIDYLGKLAWQNTYNFDPDKDGFGNNLGEAVTEVNGGYIVGGSGTISEGNESIGVSALTKIASDGTKIWSKAATYSNEGGSFYGLKSMKGGSQFMATGRLADADFIIYDAQTANTVQIVNFDKYSDYHKKLAKVENDYFTLKGDSRELELYGISESLGTISSYPRDEYAHYTPLNIDVFADRMVTLGYTQDTESGNWNLFAIKSYNIAPTIWHFYYSSNLKQEAVGAYEVSEGPTGIVANEFEGDQSHIILL